MGTFIDADLYAADVDLREKVDRATVYINRWGRVEAIVGPGLCAIVVET